MLARGANDQTTTMRIKQSSNKKRAASSDLIIGNDRVVIK
jgi:hypothetical protein